MRVRRGEQEESSEIAGLWRRSRAVSVPEIPPPVHTEEEVRAWFEKVVLPEREVWVAEDDDGVVVGVLVLEGNWVDQLYVEPRLSARGGRTAHKRRVGPDIRGTKMSLNLDPPMR